MSKRKQTPDVLADILGGNKGDVPDVTEVEETLQKRRPPRPRRQTDATGRWEYRIVSFQDYKGWRPRYINDREFADWTNGPLIHEYLEQMGEEGWELAAASSGKKMYGRSDNHQVYLKRRI